MHRKKLRKKALKKHCEKKVKLLKMSNFTFFHNVFLKHFSSLYFNEYICRKGLRHLIVLSFSRNYISTILTPDACSLMVIHISRN